MLVRTRGELRSETKFIPQTAQEEVHRVDNLPLTYGINWKAQNIKRIQTPAKTLHPTDIKVGPNALPNISQVKE